MIRTIPTTTAFKDWGYEILIENSADYCCKRLMLRKGWQCSLHLHKIKAETFHIVSGKVRLELESRIQTLVVGDTVRIPRMDKHRFSGLEASEILEISTHHSEEDVYRLEPSRRMSDVTT